MPRYAPATDKHQLLTQIAAFFATKTEFVEQEEMDLSSEDGILAGLERAVMGHDEFLPAAWKDLSKVEFYAENVDIRSALPMNKGTGLHGVITRPSGLSMVVGMLGGDWETPLVFILYHDGKTIRGYIPTKGNTFNTKTKAAWGNSQADDLSAYLAAYADHPFTKGRSGDDLIDAARDDVNSPINTLDPAAIFADIDARIQVRPGQRKP